MEAALKGMLAPKLKEVLTGKCEVRQTFNITGVGTIAGCYVIDGKIIRGGKLRCNAIRKQGELLGFDLYFILGEYYVAVAKADLKHSFTELLG